MARNIHALILIAFLSSSSFSGIIQPSMTARICSCLYSATSKNYNLKFARSLLSCRKSILSTTFAITAPFFVLGLVGHVPTLSAASFTTLLGTWALTTALAIPPLGIYSFIQSPPKSAKIYLGCCLLTGILGVIIYRTIQIKLEQARKERQQIEITRLRAVHENIQKYSREMFGTDVKLSQLPTRDILAFIGYQPSGIHKLSNRQLQEEDRIRCEQRIAPRGLGQTLIKTSLLFTLAASALHCLLLGANTINDLDRWIA